MEIKNREKSIEIVAQIPGTVFEALLENKIIEAPFYGLNEHNMEWIYESDWVFQYEFDLKQDFLEHRKINFFKFFVKERLIHPDFF